MGEDYVKLYNTSLFNDAVSMSKSNVEWCSRDTSKERMVSCFETLYWSFLELIEENYKIPLSEGSVCFLADISNRGLLKMKQECQPLDRNIWFDRIGRT
jgi:hypothetical protein